MEANQTAAIDVRAPRFIAIKNGEMGSLACARVAEEYRKLHAPKVANMMILRFVDQESLMSRLRDENGNLDEVVLMYPRPGTSLVWYKDHIPNADAPEVSWLPWRWGVGINPKLHEARKVSDLAQAAKSIHFTYGVENFTKAYKSNKIPWGDHCNEVVAMIQRDKHLAEKYFRATFITPTSGGWNHPAMAD